LELFTPHSRVHGDVDVVGIGIIGESNGDRHRTPFSSGDGGFPFSVSSPFPDPVSKLVSPLSPEDLVRGSVVISTVSSVAALFPS
jgi:hypothetical protein